MPNDNQIQVELQSFMGSDLDIANSAWTSSLSKDASNNKTQEQVESLVSRLAKDGHSTPFESVVFRFWIKMPIQTDRQHMTHRIASHNGMSGRYRTMPAEWLSMPDDVYAILDKAMHADKIKEKYEELCFEANSFYSGLLPLLKSNQSSGYITNPEYKRAREFLRGVLPQNNMTERVTIMNLRSFANYQRLRNSEHAQPEIRLVAQLMLEQVKDKGIAPVAIAALEANDWRI